MRKSDGICRGCGEHRVVGTTLRYFNGVLLCQACHTRANFSSNRFSPFAGGSSLKHKIASTVTVSMEKSAPEDLISPLVDAVLDIISAD